MGGPRAIAAGGGLAGAAFALELARHGHRVLILESTRQAQHKVCGEFLSGETRALLEYLGIDVGGLGASEIGTLRLVAGRDEAVTALPFPGSGLSRFLLDQVLLDRAAEAGAEIERGVSVSGIEETASGVAVRANGGLVEGTSIALATGKHGVRQFPRPATDKVGFKIQVQVAHDVENAFAGLVQLVLFDDGYIGACMVENGLMTLCWIIGRETVKRIGSGWKEQSAYLAGQSPLLADLFASATPVWEKPVAISGLAYGFLRRRPIAPAIFPVGDQLAVINSFTGDGMAIALYSGIAAAQAVLAQERAAEYQRRLVARLRPQFLLAGAVNGIFATRFLQRPAIKAARLVPGLVAAIACATRFRNFRDVMEPRPALVASRAY